MSVNDCLVWLTDLAWHSELDKLVYPLRVYEEIELNLRNRCKQDLPRRRVRLLSDVGHRCKCDTESLVITEIRREMWIIEVPGCCKWRESPYKRLSYDIEALTGLRVEGYCASKPGVTPLFYGGSGYSIAYCFRRDVLMADARRSGRSRKKCIYCHLRVNAVYERFVRSERFWNRTQYHEKHCVRFMAFADELRLPGLTDKQRRLVDELIYAEAKEKQAGRFLAKALRSRRRNPRRFSAVAKLEHRWLMRVGGIRRRMTQTVLAVYGWRDYQRRAEREAATQARQSMKLIKRFLGGKVSPEEILSSQTEAG